MNKEYKKRIDRGIQYIEVNLKNRISLAEVAHVRAPLITLILRHFSQKINFRLKNTHSFCHSVQFLPVLADFGQNNPLVTHTH